MTRYVSDRSVLDVAGVQRGVVMLGVGGTAILIGFLVVLSPQIAFLVTLLLVCVVALAVPAGYWAIAALIAAITFRGLVGIGALPSVATYIDIPLAWGALAAALLRARATSQPPLLLTRRYLQWLAALSIAMLVSWALTGSEILRPILYFALLAEPFALITALLLDQPSRRTRRALQYTMFAIIAIQIPITYWQAVNLGLRDPVQGTLYGAGAGAHTISAVVIVGSIWILCTHKYPVLWRVVIVSMLFIIPFIADAKQVLFALPAVLLVGDWRRAPKDTILRVTFVAGALAVLILLMPAGRTSVRFIDEARAGKGGKQEAAALVWQAAMNDPTTLVFGQGPAESVSRSAFMTTDLLLRQNSPLRTLGLKPAQFASDTEGAARTVSGGGSSFNSGLSSALGVFGDLGIAGVIAYAGLLTLTLRALRKTVSPEGIAASAGFAMFAVLGLVFDWWEQPPFSIILAVMAGLALCERPSRTIVLAQDVSR